MAGSPSPHRPYTTLHVPCMNTALAGYSTSRQEGGRAMAPSTPGAADAFFVVDEEADGLDLREVRLLLEKLVERRLLAPLSVEDQALWGQLIEREKELLAPQ
ncbi:MAG TPA: hypothetical protein VFW24_03340 [Acidimicrobiales bacterium]|nr:hypothetical protein [Acidimicrobiales bacterium]